MTVFKVYYNGKLMGAYRSKTDTIREFKNSETFRRRFGDPEYVSHYEVTKVETKTKRKSGRLNKTKALMDYFGYSKKEAREMLKDMGE